MSNRERSLCSRSETEHHYRCAVERVIDAMHQHLDEDFSLEDMATVAIMSPFHLNRVFRQLTGVPPCRFLTALRLEAAKRLLLTSGLSVTDTSLEVGYNSLGTFTRRFTELVGVSPGRFRRLAKSGARSAFESLRRGAETTRFSSHSNTGVGGEVMAPEGFSGPIFVGLFTTAVPQSRPLACSVLNRPGSFRLSTVPDGWYYLVSAGLPWSLDPRDYLLYEKAMRAGVVGHPMRIENGATTEPCTLTLRPSKLTDPPILMTLPLLLSEKMSRPAATSAGVVAEAAHSN